MANLSKTEYEIHHNGPHGNQSRVYIRYGDHLIELPGIFSIETRIAADEPSSFTIKVNAAYRVLMHGNSHGN